MILWDIRTGERLRTFEGHDRGLACIEFKVVCNLSPYLRLSPLTSLPWKLLGRPYCVGDPTTVKSKSESAATGDCLRTLVGHEALVRALSFDPRSGRLVSASYDKSIKLWDLGSEVRRNALILVTCTTYSVSQVNLSATSKAFIQVIYLTSSLTCLAS